MLRLFRWKWIFLLLIICSDLIIALRTQREFFYFFFWLLLSFALLGFLWVVLMYSLANLVLKRKVVGRIVEDDYLEIEAVIENKSRFPLFNFILEDYLPCAVGNERQKRKLVEYLGAGATSHIKYECWCPLRGRYKLGQFSLFIFDPWGLFFLKKNYPVYSEVYVYPQLFPIKRMPPLIKGTAPWFGIESSRVSGDEHEFYGIREYKQGDPIKRIHWLTTARKNRLIIKQFQHQVFYRATLLFNLDKDSNFGEGKESVVEYIVKIAASVCKYYIERDVSLEVIAHTGELVHIPFNKGEEHLEDILRFLAIAQAESRVSLSEIFEEFSRYIPNDSSLIVILSDKDWQQMLSMLYLKARNVSLVPLIIVTSTFLTPTEKSRAIAEVQMKMPQGFGSAPIFFSRGESLEEPFYKF